MHSRPAKDTMSPAVQGHHILTFMQAIPQDSEPAPIIWSYADLNLQTLASAGLLKTRAPPQAPSPAGSSRAAQSVAASIASPGAPSQTAALYSPTQQLQACRSAAMQLACAARDSHEQTQLYLSAGRRGGNRQRAGVCTGGGECIPARNRRSLLPLTTAGRA